MFWIYNLGSIVTYRNRRLITLYVTQMVSCDRNRAELGVLVKEDNSLISCTALQLYIFANEKLFKNPTRCEID